MDENRSFDVIIIGLGPVGAVVANLLAPFNFSILIIEKNKMIHPTPRAIHFDGEVMRIFQNIGLSSYIKKPETIKKIKLLNMSKICLIYVGNLELKKSTITFPFLK